MRTSRSTPGSNDGMRGPPTAQRANRGQSARAEPQVTSADHGNRFGGASVREPCISATSILGALVIVGVKSDADEAWCPENPELGLRRVIRADADGGMSPRSWITRSAAPRRTMGAGFGADGCKARYGFAERAR